MASTDNLKNNLEKIQTARNDIKTALENEGETVNNDIRTYAAIIPNVNKVKTVNNIAPDENKNVQIDASNINVDDTTEIKQTVKEAIEKSTRDITTLENNQNMIYNSRQGSVPAYSIINSGTGYKVGQYMLATLSNSAKIGITVVKVDENGGIIDVSFEYQYKKDDLFLNMNDVVDEIQFIPTTNLTGEPISGNNAIIKLYNGIEQTGLWENLILFSNSVNIIDKGSNYAIDDIIYLNIEDDKTHNNEYSNNYNIIIKIKEVDTNGGIISATPIIKTLYRQPIRQSFILKDFNAITIKGNGKNAVLSIDVLRQNTNYKINDIEFRIDSIESEVTNDIYNYIDESISEYSIIESTTIEGYSKSYSLTKDGVEVGTKINIPKDLVIKSGNISIVTEADRPYTGALIGDKYLDIELNDPASQHIYISVKDLVDVYKGSNGNKINITIDATNNIKANIVSGSIEETDLTQELQDKINNTPSNILNGNTEGSIRTKSAAIEDSSYTIGINAFAEGTNTKAIGGASHAEGDSTIANSANSHTEGRSTQTNGIASHAEGESTEAFGTNSHAEGLGTIAKSVNQHVQGKYNIEDVDNKYAHIVGNGEVDNKSNAHTIDWDGNGWFAGDIKVGGTGQDDINAKTLATTKYVDDAIKTINDKLADIQKILENINGTGGVS